MGTECGYEILEKKIEKFDAYNEPVTRFILDYYWLIFPLYLIIGKPFDVWTTNEDNGLEAVLGAITIVIVAFRSIRLFRKIPYTFKRIYDRNIISSNDSEKDIIKDKIRFLDKFEKNLNSKWGFFYGFVWEGIFLFLYFSYLTHLTHKPLPDS